MKPIGEVLKEFGFITQEHIEIALRVQKIYPDKLVGEILQELDFVTPDEVAKALALQYKVEYIDLDIVIPEPEALRLVPKDFAISVPLLPFALEDNTLKVAIEDPTDLGVYDHLTRTTGKNIKFYISDNNKIAKYALLYYYQLENPIEKRIEQIIKSQSPDVVALVDLILQEAIKESATDIHITPEELITNIFYRIDGVLHHYFALPSHIHPQLVSRIKILSSLNIAEQRIPQDGGFEFEFLETSFNIRVSTTPTKQGENIVLRVLSKNATLFNIDNLGYEPDYIKKIEEYFSKPYGIILITGPTGSGKTTTLYSALRKINSLEKNILTVEDPVEYRFTFIRQTEVNPKAGYTFSKAIKAFMRQDPDVMLIGEIRDEETAELAIRASITGHLVLSTLHTNDALSSISRLEDMHVKEYLLAEGLLLVISQRLVRKLCPYCKKEITIKKEELLNYGFDEDEIAMLDNELHIYDKVGCEKCKNTGYLRRTAVAELFEVDKEIKAMIAKGVSSLEIEQKARQKGMRTLKEDALRKIIRGITTLEELKRVIE
ncbi:MAG: type II/IV secretion system protein [Epsilonproteobacteria bacterium]|nr:type II/IV secretion system protein [Campylobacterota bacterium]